MNHRLNYTILLLILSMNCFSQNQQGIDWSKAGTNNTILSSNQFDFKDYQNKYLNLSNNDLIEKLIDSLSTSGGVIYFKSDTYQFNRTIKLKSNVSFLGQHRDSVKLVFDNHEKGDLIAINGSAGIKVSPTTDMKISSSTLVIKNSNLNIGDVLYFHDNDKNLVTNEWALGSTGQLFRVVKIERDKIILSNSARRSYLISSDFNIQKINTIENCHISNLSITRSDHTPLHSSNIFLNFANECSIQNVKSYKCSYSHIALEKSLNCLIKECSFSESIKYGKGGNGYGVVVQFGTSDCKIKNNCFCTLRHSMLVQIGANGNVFEGNSSSNPTWTGTILPKHSSGDIVLHGNYPYSNLFKNNNCHHIVIDNSHGQNGPSNHFIQNQLSPYGVHMNKQAGNNMFFIDNHIKGNRIKAGYKISGKNHIQKGNMRNGKKLNN